MTVDNNAAAREAQARAARLAAQREAARRQAQQAQQRQAQAQARQQQNKTEEAKAPEPAKALEPKVAVDKPEGLFATLKEKFVEAVNGKATPQQVKADREAIAKDFKEAKSPEDLQAVQQRASSLASQADVSDDPEVQAQLADVRALNDKVTKAAEAMEKVQQIQGDLESTDPAVRANAQAALLSRPAELADAVKGLGPLADSPLGKDLKASTEKIAKEATPAKLAEQLAADPDLSNYPPGFSKNLIALRAKQDPALNAALDKVGEKLLEDATDGEGENPLSYDAVKANPDLARLIGPVAGANAEQYGKVTESWGKAVLEKALDGAKGKDEVEKALEQYQEDMLGLAGMGVDPTVVANLTASTLEGNKKLIEDKADDNGGGILGKLKDIGDWVKDKVSGLIDFVKDKVGDVAKKAAEFFYDKVIDPALDNSALGEDTDTFKGENTGIMGDLVTNRLEVGESAFIRLDANAKIAGVSVGAGGQLEIKRVPKLGEDGEPLPPVDGVPQTELQVKVLVEAQAGVGLEAEFGKAMGKDTSVKGNDKVAGAGVEASASAEAGVKGQAELTFSFDATDPQAMEDMTGLFKEAAETGLKAAIPGIGPVLAAANAPEAADAALKFGRHLETVRIEAGAYANASASASASAGLVDKPEETPPAGGAAAEAGKPSLTKGGEAEAAQTPEEKETLRQKAEKAAAGELLAGANMDLGSVEAAVGGEVSVGIERNFKTGETTVYLSAKGEAKAQGGVGDLNAGGSAEYNRKIAVTLGPDGKLKDLKISEGHSKEKFAGLGQTDIMGRVDSEALAQVSSESTITVTRKYKNLDDFKGKSPTEIAGQLLRDAHSDKNPNLAIEDIKAEETTKMELGGEIMGTGVKLTLGHTQESDIEQSAWNETRKATAGAKK